MASVMYRVLPKTTLNFTSLNGGGQLFEFYPVQHIDLTSWAEFNAIYRIHSYSISDTPSIRMLMRPEFPTSDDPGMDSHGQTIWASTGLVALSGLTTPWMKVVSSLSGQGWGYSLRLRVDGQQGTTPGNFAVTVSVDLVAKS